MKNNTVNELKSTYEAIVYLIDLENISKAVLLMNGLIKDLRELAKKNQMTEILSELDKDLIQLKEEGNEVSVAISLGESVKQISNKLKPSFLQKYPIDKWILKNRKKVIVGISIISMTVSIVLIIKFLNWRSSGLKGVYYSDIKLDKVHNVRIDRKIDFHWDHSSPMRGMNRDGFSIRWKGKLLVENEGDYSFILEMDDGARLYINNKKIISDWTVRGRRKKEGRMTLSSGLVPITVDYFEKGGNATIRLLWRKPGEIKYNVIGYKNLRR